MRPALVIAVKDLRERIRDRSALILGILAPLGLATIFSLLLPSADTAFRADYAFVDLDDSAVSAAFLSGPLAGLEEAGLAGVVVLGDEEAARAAIEADEVDAARRLIASANGGAERHEGRMIERMHVEQAQALLAKARC